MHRAQELLADLSGVRELADVIRDDDVAEKPAVLSCDASRGGENRRLLTGRADPLHALVELFSAQRGGDDLVRGGNGGGSIGGEHPVTGDPQRGLITSGLIPGGAGGGNFMMEQPNRGKKSIGIDLGHPDGHEALMRLVETADVFLTNALPHVREKLGVDVEDLRARNPSIIVARGSGQGAHGPESDKGGYDGASFWARGGVAGLFPGDAEGWPQGQPAPAFGDVMGGLAVAGAIAAALAFHDPEDAQSVDMQRLLAERDAATFTAEVTGLDPEHALFDRIRALVETRQATPAA